MRLSELAAQLEDIDVTTDDGDVITDVVVVARVQSAEWSPGECAVTIAATAAVDTPMQYGLLHMALVIMNRAMA